MLSKYTYRAAIIGGTVGIPFGGENTPTIANLTLENTGTFLDSPSTVAVVGGDISVPFSAGEKPRVPNPDIMNRITSLEINFEKDVESGVTQALEDEQAFFAFPPYDDEDILDWDTAIIDPPPRPSGTIRVKLKYIGRSKPFPIDNFWE